MRQWIVEALEALGGSAARLSVAKHVWAEHESELQHTGDLLFTWQLDLVRIAEQMCGEGRLLLTAPGQLALPSRGVAPVSSDRSWSEAEINAAVGAYLDLLRAEHSGRPRRTDTAIADVVDGTGRDRAQVEVMFAAIAHVVGEHDITPLSGIGPRSNVPRGVRAAVAAALS